jgi:hypothetical protein
MANENSRYNVRIILEIKDATTGAETPFSRTIQEYSDMSYEFMQGLQATAIPVLVNTLLGMGNEISEEIKGKRLAKGQNK